MDTTQQAVKEEETDTKTSSEEDILVDVEKVSKIYGKNQWVVKKVTTKISKGECVAFVGPNGAGKSTLGKLIANVIKATSGIVDYYFEEENIFRAIGYQAKEQAWPNGFKVKDVVALWTNIYEVTDKEWIHKLMDIFMVGPNMDKYLSKLSSVKLQLFAIFLAFLYKPELVVIDDLSSSVDFETKDRIANFFKEYIEKGNSIVLVYPDEFFLENCVNRVIYLLNGRIANDLTTKEIKKQFGGTLGYIKSIVNQEATAKNAIQADPFFEPVLKKLDTTTDALNKDYAEYFEGKVPEEYYSFDAALKNTLFYLSELRKDIVELASTSLTTTSVSKVRQALNKNVKNLDSILKQIDKLKKNNANIKHLSRIEKDLYNTRKLFVIKFDEIFKNDKLIINGDEMDVELEKDDKKKLRSLKERYIKEELKIIRLESRKMRHSNESIPKRMLRNLTNKEKSVIDKVVTDADVSDAASKVVTLDNGKIILKNETSITKKDIVLYDKKKNADKNLSGSFYAGKSNNDVEPSLANGDIYYDKTTQLGFMERLADKKKSFIDRLLKNRKKDDK